MTTLELNDEETRVLRDALNAYTHLHLGSFNTAADRVLMWAKCAPRAISDVREALAVAQECITGTRNGGPSIGNPEVSNDARIARRLEAILTGDEMPLKMYNRDGSVRE